MQGNFVPIFLLCASFLAPPPVSDERLHLERRDTATLLPIPLEGSLQNGAWSPDAKSIVLTRFRHGYNRGPADIFIYQAATTSLRPLVSEGSDNVNMPGASWNRLTNTIVFSSSRGHHDEIFITDHTASPGDEAAVTQRSHQMAYEPTLSPDGQWIVFESHPVDVENRGVITRYKLDHTSVSQFLTDAAADCRQPNWSPAGDRIVYQQLVRGQWDIWVMNADGSGKRRLTKGPGDNTDASFSPDGQWVVYSSERESGANLFVISLQGGTSVRVTDHDGYDGAPSWSSSEKILFESSPGDPDRSAGTRLWVIDAPAHE